jgi:hypothetical protein
LPITSKKPVSLAAVVREHEPTAILVRGSGVAAVIVATPLQQMLLCSRPHDAFDLAPADADIVEFQVAAGAELRALPAAATPRREGIKQAAQGVAFRTEGLADAIGRCCAENR